MTAAEGALFPDGPASTFTNGSLARILTYESAERIPASEFVHEVGSWAEPSAIFGVNGIVEVLPIDKQCVEDNQERDRAARRPLDPQVRSGGVVALGESGESLVPPNFSVLSASRRLSPFPTLSRTLRGLLS